MLHFVDIQIIIIVSGHKNDLRIRICSLKIFRHIDAIVILQFYIQHYNHRFIRMLRNIKLQLLFQDKSFYMQIRPSHDFQDILLYTLRKENIIITYKHFLHSSLVTSYSVNIILRF